METSLETLAAIGEFVGGIAVLVTIAYLAVQVRQTKRHIIRQNARDLVERNNQVLALPLQNEDLRNSHFAVMRDYGNAKAEDRFAFGEWMFIWISNWEQASIDRRRGDFRGVDLDGYAEGIAMRLRTPGGQRWWEEIGRESFSSKTIAALESKCHESDRSLLSVHGFQNDA